jgi:alpha-L-arabinofuranosidase
MKTPLLAAACWAGALSILAQPTVTVDVNQLGHAISPTLWGIFFEDINLSADGGLYPELVRNRSFEDSSEPEHWNLTNDADGKSSMTIDTSYPLNPLNRRSLRVSVDGAFTLANEGYWGMNVVQGDTYICQLAARTMDQFSVPLTVRLASSSGAELAKAQIDQVSGRWKYYTVELTASSSDSEATLQLSASGKGTLFLDMVSLLPKNTWKDHGLRVDLAQSLDALHPSFMRFPGGNWIEGDDFAHIYHWKTTIGDLDARTPLWNTWGYNTTQGLGFHEYLQLCEDLGAEPLFDINVGMSLRDSVPLGQMGQWIQDALDAIEYANGPTNTVWGGLRAQAGHPAPFRLRYLEIGNENGGPDYQQRWALLVNAIRQKYPAIHLIANSDLRGRPYPTDPAPDIVDEHYYESPESFMNRASQYDSYDRQGPKIFIGEYAVTRKAGQGNLRAALGEAAFMTGIERNSDVVVLASYAPLFVNLNHRAWNPDLITFDDAHWYGSPSYYVQQMFSQNRGDAVLPVTVQSGEVNEEPESGRIGVGSWRTQAEFKDIKVTAPDGKILFTSDFTTGDPDWKFFGSGDWKVQDGALRQTSEKEFVRALAGDPAWTDYSLTLKARKISGREGFLVLFHVRNDEDRTWWNIGGWDNTRDGVELDRTVDSKPLSVETGRWYDIRLNVSGQRVQCFLDGRLIHDLQQPRRSTHRLYASASHDSNSGDTIVKVVNAANLPLTAEVNLRGAAPSKTSATAIVLTSKNPEDENSLDEPLKISPKTETFDVQGPTFSRIFPANSLTVLRIGAPNATP